MLTLAEAWAKLGSILSPTTNMIDQYILLENKQLYLSFIEYFICPSGSDCKQINFIFYQKFWLIWKILQEWQR